MIGAVSMKRLRYEQPTALQASAESKTIKAIASYGISGNVRISVRSRDIRATSRDMFHIQLLSCAAHFAKKHHREAGR